MSIIKQIIAVQDCVSSCELSTSSLIQRLWLVIYENADITDVKDQMIDSASSQARLQLMMQYIHQNYSHNISLEELADHARISKSTALNLFRKFYTLRQLIT